MIAPGLVILSLSYLGAPQRSSAASDTAGAEQYEGPGHFVKSNPEEMAEWEGSAHARAYIDPSFQTEWKKLGSPVSCLSCHTTGFNETDGTFQFEGVTCEQCHGPGFQYINRSVLLCATCHSGPYPTYNEWLLSGPGHSNATCIFCHSPHSLELGAKNATAVCSRCHMSHLELLRGSKHGEFGVGCEVCHMYMQPAKFERVDGTISISPAVTGHSFFIPLQSLDCNTCHNVSLSKHNVLGVNASSCLSCHGEIHGLRLRLINGTVYPLDEPVPLCAECHNERFQWWRQGTHGALREAFSPCTDCHNPHDPIVAGFDTLDFLPPRETGPSPSIPQVLSIALIVEALIFAIIIVKEGGNG